MRTVKGRSACMPHGPPSPVTLARWPVIHPTRGAWQGVTGPLAAIGIVCLESSLDNRPTRASMDVWWMPALADKRS